MQEKSRELRVLIADKSSYVRLVLQDIVDSEQDMQATGVAADADELLGLLGADEADLVILDCDLPGNENLLVLKRIFSEVPKPVLLLITQEQLTLDLLKQAVELGVYGIVLKPGRGRYANYRSIAAEFLRKVRAVSETELYNVQRRLEYLQQEMVLLAERPVKRKSSPVDTIIVIGASTGGTQAVESIVSRLSPELQAAVLVVLHLPEKFTRSYAKRLQRLTPLKVVEGRAGSLLRTGKVIVAPGGKNMVVEPFMGDPANLKVGFTDEPTPLFDQPSLDLLLRSVAQCAVRNMVGVVLTGMGKDGTLGASYMREQGGFMVAQDEATSVIFGMARSADRKSVV